MSARPLSRFPFARLPVILVVVSAPLAWLDGPSLTYIRLSSLARLPRLPSSSRPPLDDEMHARSSRYRW